MRRLATNLLCCTLALPLLALSSAPRASWAQAGENAALGAHTAATHMYKTGNFKQAAELYHTAFKIDPQPAFLFNAARSEQRLMLLDVAEKHFKQVLQLKGLDERTRSRAKMHLQEIAAVRKVVASAKASSAKPATPPAGKNEARPAPTKPVMPSTTLAAGQGTWKAPAGWASVGTGAVLTGVGAWLLISYMSDQTALDERQDKVNGDGKVLGISYDKYEEEQQALWTRRGLGIGATGVGLAAAGVGAWMLLTAPEDNPVAILPTARGALLVWRF